MVFAVLREPAGQSAAVFRLDCSVKPRDRGANDQRVLPDSRFRPMPDMQRSMSAARRMCEVLINPPSAWHGSLACLARDSYERRAVMGLVVSGVGASGVIFCTAVVSLLAAFWPGDPFVVPLTGRAPRVVFWMMIGAGLLCLPSWTRLRRAIAPSRRAWKEFSECLNASCVYFSVDPPSERRVGGTSAGVAMMCALARILPEQQQPVELDWQIPLRDPGKHWVFAIAIDDPEQGSLKPVDGLAEKLAAILRHNSAEGNTRLTHAVFHRDNQTEVEKAWFNERGTELRTMPQPGGCHVAEADGLTMFFCRKKSDLIRALQHPQRGWRLGIVAALVGVCGVTTAVFPTAVPPLLSATCTSGPSSVTGTERLLVKVERGDVALCVLSVTAVGFPGPFEIGAGDTQQSAVRVVADGQVTSGETRRTRQREITVYFSSRLAGVQETHLANLTITNRGGRSAIVTILFTVGRL